MTNSPLTVTLEPGARILTSGGIAVVKRVERHRILIEDRLGREDFIRFDRLTVAPVNDDGIQAVHEALEPWWSGLKDDARQQALFRLEVIMEVLTGYRYGFAELALSGEPFPPFGEGFLASLTQRTDEMAKQITFERGVDRKIMRRVRAGELKTESVSGQTIRLWIRRFKESALRGLADGRRTGDKQGYDALDPRLVRTADEEFARFDGTISEVNLGEIRRRIFKRLWDEHRLTDENFPQGLTQEYLSHRYHQLGTGTRAHKSRSHRKVAAKQSYPGLLHPAHVSSDFTRIDNLVYDDLHERVISVEVCTFISVASRVICSLRVTPRSGNANDLGLALYDTMRPQSMVLSGTTADHFRWCGVPESLGLPPDPSPRERLVSGKQEIEGTHVLPAVTPGSVRSDNGANYLSEQFRSVLAHWGIDHYTSRGKKPNDNPHQERIWEVIQRACQALPGYKGRSVHERGSTVLVADQPLLTWRELQDHLQRWVALDYHRTPHRGLTIPGTREARVTPLEMFDWLLSVTGRITVPQHHDLIFDFLPIRWLTPGNAGVEYRGLTYDGEVLDTLGHVRPGTYREEDARVPFFYDPRDVTRLWHRSLEDGRVHELRWRAHHRLETPLGEVIRDEAIRQIRARGGNAAISRRQVERELITTVGEIAAIKTDPTLRNKVTAANIRWEQAQIDHAEVADATAAADQATSEPQPRPRLEVVPTDQDPAGDDGPTDDGEAWPDYDALGY